MDVENLEYIQDDDEDDALEKQLRQANSDIDKKMQKLKYVQQCDI